MKYWTTEDALRSDEYDDVLEVTVAVEKALWAAETAPARKLVRIGVTDVHEDCWRYELEVELAPGVTLPVECGLLEDSDELRTEDVVDEVLEGVLACAPHVMALADTLHEARMRARKLLGRWHAEGLSVRLIDVRLAPYDHWRGDEQPSLLVLVEGFNERLEPQVDVLNVEKPHELEAALTERRADLEAGFMARKRLMELGASGTIEQLALNALQHHGRIEDGLRRLAGEWRFWLPDDTAIVMTQGHVRAGNGDPDAAVKWTGTSMTVGSTFIHKDRLTAAIGRPVSELYHHPFLSTDMVVLEASTELGGGLPRLEVRFTNPTRLFCSTSGRVWDAPDHVPQPALERSHGTVVQFPRRRPAA